MAGYKTQEQRMSAFMSRVQKDADTGCWNWQGELNKQGYGECWSFSRRERAHQAAYREFVGEVPVGLLIRHKCDNPRCCNPDHLTVGTQADNIRDKVERDRQAKGMQHGSAKLTDEQIFYVLRSDLSQRKLAAELGVTQPLIGKIRRRELWKHLEAA